MATFRRTNKLDMETVLVAGCDSAGAEQNLASAGAMVDATTALGIVENQIGVLSWDFDGTDALGNFITPGATAAQVKAIKVIQGTSASADTTTADVFEAGPKAYLESPIIHADAVRSVTVKKCKPGMNGALAFVDFPTTSFPLSEQEYGVAARLDSVRNQRDYGRTGGEYVSANYLTPDYTALGTVNPLDHMLQHVLFDLNRNSKAVYMSNPGYTRGGNGNYVAFAINTGGGAGTALGTLECGDSVDFMVDTYSSCDDCGNPGTPVTSSVTMTVEMLRTLANIIEENANNTNLTDPITGTSTIEVITTSTAGAAANVDAVIIMGLPHSTSPIDNDIIENDMYQIRTRVDGDLSLGFRLDPTYSKCCVMPEEAIGKGSQWLAEANNRHQKGIHTMQSYPSAWHAQGQKFVNKDKYYTSYIIDFLDWEETLTVREQSPKQLTLLFCCDWLCDTDNNTVGDMATALAANNPDMATITTACCAGGTPEASTATVPDVVASLDAWLISISPSIVAKGDATAGGPYLIV